VRPGALSSWSFSSSVASGIDSRPFLTTTWHVEHAQTPPQAWSISTPFPSAISRIEPFCPSRE
jgi:hypothetical protein